MAQGPSPVRIVNSSAIGNSWFVNETTGSDNNPGSALLPFATLAAAHDAATPNNGDVVYFMGTVHTAETVLWSKNGVSLVGLLAPSNNNRSRISQTGSTVFTPLVRVTGAGCSFINIGTFHGFASATAQVCWQEAGGRNFYSGVQFFGGGNATAAAQAGMRSLTIAGDGENLFEGCTFGLNTVTRATGNNATLEYLGGTQRSIIRRGVFQAYVTNAADVHVKAATGSIDREQILEDCTFLNSVGSGATAMTAAISAAADCGGALILNRPFSYGATKLSAAGPVEVVGIVPVAATSGLAVVAA